MVADAKLANWSWSDRHRRRLNEPLKKFIWAMRQIAAYGFLCETQYTAIITPNEICLCRLVDCGKAWRPIGDAPMSQKSIGVQGKSIDWAAYGPGSLTVTLSLTAWILMAMNESHRSIAPLGSQTQLNEWDVLHYDGKTLYRNRISQLTTEDVPSGNIILHRTNG